jgi:hypothetical protein
MKPVTDWTEDDILAMITDGVQESITLDYKACGAIRLTPSADRDHTRTEMSKDVSAFANAGGGKIIYGVTERGHLPGDIDDGYEPNRPSREWFDQIISTTIEPRIDGITIKQIPLSGAKAGKVIYVVDIPQSRRAPHMALDHRYYKRTNDRCVMMHDYEVRDVMRRQEAPDLRIEFRLPSGEVRYPQDVQQPMSNPIELTVHLLNDALVPAEYIGIRLYFDTRVQVLGYNGFSGQPGSAVITRANEKVTVNATILTMNWSIRDQMPVWAGMGYKLTKDPLRIAVPLTVGTQDYLLGWQLCTPRTPTKDGSAALRVFGPTIRIIDDIDAMRFGY